MPVYQLPSELIFPDPSLADPDGMLAVGGDLSVERLTLAYSHGIFPWFSEDEPIIWWSPHPRMVMFPSEIKTSKTMRSVLRKREFIITMDRAFTEIVSHCAQTPREGQSGTWITKEMQGAYAALHRHGLAHSVEAWKDGKLCGGLYGVTLGKVFFGESMFSHVSNASKAAYITFVNWLNLHKFEIVDCQVHTPHLESLGARLIPRPKFIQHLKKGIDQPSMPANWSGFQDQLLTLQF